MVHSWFGNLITCQNWSNFWLNEGFTTYVERKVSSQIWGEDFSKVNAFRTNQTMYAEMVKLGIDHSFSSLYPICGANIASSDSASSGV